MRTPILPLFLALLVPPVAFAADPDIKIADVPRETQMGKPPAPAGAPGGGKYFPPLPANRKLPTLWLIGDSTVRNGTLGENGPTGQWGWGAPITAFFDPHKINVVNRAFGGTSSRTFYNGFFWQNLKPLIRKGDFVLMQFGANDNGGAKGKGGLKGTGEDTETIERDGKTEVVHSFGWYLRQFVKETRDQGGKPIICSLTPRKKWTAYGHFPSDTGNHVAWSAEAAAESKVPFVNLNELIARDYDKRGPEKVDALYVPSPKENLHTGWDGAVVNAGCVVAGLKGLKEDPLAAYFSNRAGAVAPVTLPAPGGNN